MNNDEIAFEFQMTSESENSVELTDVINLNCTFCVFRGKPKAASRDQFWNTQHQKNQQSTPGRRS